MHRAHSWLHCGATPARLCPSSGCEAWPLWSSCYRSSACGRLRAARPTTAEPVVRWVAATSLPAAQRVAATSLPAAQRCPTGCSEPLTWQSRPVHAALPFKVPDARRSAGSHCVEGAEAQADCTYLWWASRRPRATPAARSPLHGCKTSRPPCQALRCPSGCARRLQAVRCGPKGDYVRLLRSPGRISGEPVAPRCGLIRTTQGL